MLREHCNSLALFVYQSNNIGILFLYLFDKLGKPNDIWRSNKGSDYVYYFFDTKAMPKEFGEPFDCGYIYFSFSKDGKYLTSIGQGVLDY